MYIANITDENISINSCTDDSDNNIVLEISPLLILITIVPCGASLVCLISFMVYTLVKPLINKKMEKILYPNHPCRCIITGPSNVGKTYF